jgi:hypothetical protein
MVGMVIWMGMGMEMGMEMGMTARMGMMEETMVSGPRAGGPGTASGRAVRLCRARRPS